MNAKIHVLIWGGLLLVVFLQAEPRAQTCPGSCTAWGENRDDQCDVPEPNADFVALAGGKYHSLGIKADSTLVAWGDNVYEQCDIPSPNSGFVALAAGWAHSLGLKVDGTIVAWGGNQQGQCGVPSPNSGFIAVASGDDHSLGLKADGRIVAWGNNLWGECNVPEPNEDFVAIAAGWGHSLGLKSDHSVVVWGSNHYGQHVVPGFNADFEAIAASGYHSLGLKDDGTIVAWGRNDRGQCNVPTPSDGFTAIAAGWQFSLGLRPDGTAVAWGDNYYGQCNIAAPNAHIAAIAPGFYHCLVLRGAGIWHVPGDVPTIQDAVNYACAGDTVLVACGEYQERGIELRDDVTVRSETGQADCVTIDGEGLDRIFLATNISGARLEGFTITNGLRSWGAGIFINVSSITVENCLIHGNTADWPGQQGQGGGIAIEHCNPTLRNLTIVHNTGPQGGGIALYWSHPLVENCLVAYNNGISMYCHSSVPVISCSDIYGNSAGDWTGAIAGQLGTAGNICEEPRFCVDSPESYLVNVNSPCLPANNSCGELIGTLGQGCDQTPVMISGFGARPLADGVQLSWEVHRDGVPASFRLVASTAQQTWDVPCRETSAGRFEAWDDSPHLTPGGTVDYELYYRADGDQLLLVWQQEISLNELPAQARLLSPYPNPFNPRVTIPFLLGRSQSVRLTIYDAAGREVVRLIDGEYSGVSAVVWDGLDANGQPVAAGTYIARLTADSAVQARKLSLVR